MTKLTIHFVEKVEIREIEHFEPETRKEFWTRDIIITDQNGMETEITMFSNGQNSNKNNLKLKNIKK